jgi:CRP-like cAMP-binding protein
MLASGAMASAPREAWGDLATTAFVESSILFRSLDPDARRDLLRLAQLVSFEPGEIVSPEGDDAFCLVRDGSAAVLVTAAAGPVESVRLERGALFGEGRVLGGGRPAALAAVSDVTVVSFPAPVIAAMADRFPKVRKLLEAVQAAREKEAAARLAR